MNLPSEKQTSTQTCCLEDKTKSLSPKVHQLDHFTDRFDVGLVELVRDCTDGLEAEDVRLLTLGSRLGILQSSPIPNEQSPLASSDCSRGSRAPFIYSSGGNISDGSLGDEPTFETLIKAAHVQRGSLVEECMLAAGIPAFPKSASPVADHVGKSPEGNLASYSASTSTETPPSFYRIPTRAVPASSLPNSLEEDEEADFMSLDRILEGKPPLKLLAAAESEERFSTRWVSDKTLEQVRESVTGAGSKSLAKPKTQLLPAFARARKVRTNLAARRGA